MEVEHWVPRHNSLWGMQDTTLEKPEAQQIVVVRRHGSGKQQAVIQGIHLLTRRWTDGDRHPPCEYRVYPPMQEPLTQNDPFLARAAGGP